MIDCEGFKCVDVRGGTVVLGDVRQVLKTLRGKFPLICADPPYGNIVDNEWDRVNDSAANFAQWMLDWVDDCSPIQPNGGALYVWGGIGTPGFRPFYHFMSRVEERSVYEISSHITWSKKRAYGIQWGYLFTREELAYLVKGEAKKPYRFNVPLLDKERGYDGYNPLYPAKSKFLRRTNVWTDISEIFRGKTHVAEKPTALSKVMIDTHTSTGDLVLDLFAGSASFSRAAQQADRMFVAVENDPVQFEKIVESLQ